MSPSGSAADADAEDLIGICSHGRKSPFTERIKDSDAINCISQAVRDFHAKNKVTYSFCAQLLQNLDDQPVDEYVNNQVCSFAQGGRLQ